jgi:hypothetical protein
MPYAPQNSFLPNNDPYPHYPDDWIALPPPAPPDAASPAPNLQPDASTLAIANRPPPQPLPLEALWAHIPISAATWDPPIFPDALGQYQRPAPAPFNVPSLDGLGGLLAGLTKSQRAPSYPPLGLLSGLAHLQRPPADAPLGLLGVTINQQPPAPYASASRFSLFGAPTPDFSNQSPSLLGSLGNPSWSPSSASGIGGYSGPGRELAGSDTPTAASYASGSPSYLQPDLTDYQGGSAPYPYRGNDPLDHADPAWFAPVQLPPPVFRNSFGQLPSTGNTSGDIPPSDTTQGLPGSSNLPATNSREQTDTSFAPDSRRLIPPNLAGYQSGSPLPDVALVADKKENQRNIDLFNERAFGVSPPLKSAAPRLVPPLAATSRPSAPPVQAPPTPPPSLPTSPRGPAPPPGQPSPSVPAAGGRNLNPVGEQPGPGGLGEEESTTPSGLEWQQYEKKKGSQQTTRRTTYQGKEVTVRLDYPPDKDGIVDLKKYNWWKPGYAKPFLQKMVTEDFQEQIQKYQSLDPRVKFKFSEQPPPWAVQAIEQVGGTYIVEP